MDPPTVFTALFTAWPVRFGKPSGLILLIERGGKVAWVTGSLGI
jgi:hypothetical protein